MAVVVGRSTRSLEGTDVTSGGSTVGSGKHCAPRLLVVLPFGYVESDRVWTDERLSARMVDADACLGHMFDRRPRNHLHSRRPSNREYVAFEAPPMGRDRLLREHFCISDS